MTNTATTQTLNPTDFPEASPYLGVALYHGSEVQRFTASDDLDRARRFASRALRSGWERAEICHPITGVVLDTVFAV